MGGQGARLAWRGSRSVRRLRVRARAALRVTRMRWRRSLRVRVVVATMGLGLVVVLVIGELLLSQISSGLVESRRVSARNEAAQIAAELDTDKQGATLGSSEEAATFLEDEAGKLEGPSEGPSTRYIVLIPKPGGSIDSVPGRVPRELLPDPLPAALQAAVVADPRHAQTQILTLQVTSTYGSTTAVPVVAVGSLVDLGPLAGEFELYSIFRLDREVQILNIVRSTFVVGGIALVLMVGAVSWVVTQQVVTPVRQAARTAEELASGRLDRRMRVRGEDDLARLGRAFNEMAASLERQIHQLEDLSRVQRRFVSDVSHELRTPLTTVRMASEVLYEAREDFEPAVSRSAELLRAQLDRFEALLSDLLEISRYDAGAAVLDVEAADVHELVARIVDGLAPLAERRGVQVSVAGAATPCVAEVDSRRVARIVRNLLGNAIEHAEGRPVEVTVAANADAVAVGVRDHGTGLRPGDLRMVFNRFWRGDPARARSTGGTGLGLAIALEDAHLHAGWLQAWGEPGLGANFRLSLPRRAGVVLTESPLPLVPWDAPRSAHDNDAQVPDQIAASDGTAVMAGVPPSGPLAFLAAPAQAGADEDV